MQRFVDWLTASPVRVLLAAALLAPLGYALIVFMWVPGALIVLLALRAGKPAADWQAALLSVLTLGWWLFVSMSAGPLPAALVAVGIVVPPLLVGRLLARGGSLSLAFQFSTLAAVVMLVVVHLVLVDPPGVWRPFVERLAGVLDRTATMMAAPDNDRRLSPAELREAASAVVNWGVVTWLFLVNTVVAAAVGLWAYGRQTRAALLGPAFRALQAGRTLAGVAIVAMVLAMTLHWDLASDAQRLLVGALALQGLALVHAAREILGFSGSWLVGTYVLLFVPFAALAVESALVVVGFLDNFLPLRGRLAALAARDKGRRG